MFSQVEFNKACDSLIANGVAKYRLEAMLEENILVDSMEQIDQAIIDSAEYEKVQIHLAEGYAAMREQINSIQDKQLQAQLWDDAEFLEYIALATFNVHPGLPDEIGEGIPLPTNPMASWLVTYLQRTIKYWIAVGVRRALVDAANNTWELDE